MLNCGRIAVVNMICGVIVLFVSVAVVCPGRDRQPFLLSYSFPFVRSTRDNNRSDEREKRRQHCLCIHCTGSLFHLCWTTHFDFVNSEHIHTQHKTKVNIIAWINITLRLAEKGQKLKQVQFTQQNVCSFYILLFSPLRSCFSFTRSVSLLLLAVCR